MKSIVTTTLFIFAAISQTFSQDYYNESLADSLSLMTEEQWQSLINSDYDMNTVISSQGSNEDDKWTVFHDYAHSYGYYCSNERQVQIYKIVSKHGDKLINPFFFLNDPCYERDQDILAYFELLFLKGNPSATEAKFDEIIGNYFFKEGDESWAKDYDKQDKYGKTPLMYAASFNYKGMVKFLLKNSANPNLTDKDGKTALDYAQDKKIQKMIKKIQK